MTKELDAQLDRVLGEIRAESLDDQEIEGAASRVLGRLAEQAVASAGTPGSEGATLDTCADYQAQLPALVAGTLPEARRVLIEDHVRNCLPCRRVLKAVREGRPVDAPAVAAVPTERSWLRIGAAAAGLLALLFGGFLFSGAWPGSQDDLFQVQSIEGQLFHMSDAGQVRLQPGDWIDGREEVRTGKGSRAVVRLSDESLVEINERTSFEVSSRRRGHQIRVRRGDIIVQASDQGSGSLGVSTEECLVSVKGTIFSVSHGAKGSRVSVIEGEVEVNHGRERTALLPGDQLATRAKLAALPFESELAWSQNADEYLAMLEEFRALREGLNQLMAQTATRYSSSLLDLVPQGSSVYVALPNPTATFADAYALLRERVSSNPAYYTWWQQLDEAGFAPRLDDLVQHVRELGDYLGDETVVALAPAPSDFGIPVVLSEVEDALSFRSALEQKFEDLLAEAEISGEDVPSLTFVDDPSSFAGGDGDLLVWIGSDVMAASPSLSVLQQVQAATTGGNPFVGSGFHGALAEGYTDGAQFVAGIDFAVIWDEVTSDAASGEEALALAMTGFGSARYLIVDRQQDEERAHTAATLSFDGPRRGMASWIDAPAPMASLDFFSPDTTFVAGGLSRDPGEVFDEVFGLVLSTDNEASTALDQIEAETGIRVREDLIASLGGEVAFGVDGPALPTPSWKLVAEVYDESTLQYVIETLIGRAQEQLAAEGAPGSIELVRETVSGRTYYTLSGDVEFEQAGFGAEMHYTFDGGYMIAGPSRAIVDRALTIRDSGVTVVNSQEFQDLLPTDGYIDFSGVAFNRIGEMVAGIVDQLPMPDGLSPEQQETAQALIAEMTEDAGPSLYLLYGEDERIRVVSNSPSLTPFEGLGSMFGLGAMFGEAVSSELEPLG